MTNQKPIFLLADSQLLFWKDKGNLFLNRIIKYLEKDKRTENFKASYIGASNGDNSAYFDIFITAMKQINLTNCRMIRSKPDSADKDFLNLSDIILLAGGEIKKGWDIFKQNNLNNIILGRYHKGSVLIGLSAGAIQIGSKGWDEGSNNPYDYFDTFKIIPYIIDVHDEDNDWKQLHSAIESGNEYCKGYGIPSGGGLIFYPDWSIEPVRYSLTEIAKEKGLIKQSLILIPYNFNK